jgi:hypothetical protein
MDFAKAIADLARQVSSLAGGLSKHEKRIRALEQREPHGQAVTEGGTENAGNDGGSKGGT